jgi:hypothetical protein
MGSKDWTHTRVGVDWPEDEHDSKGGVGMNVGEGLKLTAAVARSGM